MAIKGPFVFYGAKNSFFISSSLCLAEIKSTILVQNPITTLCLQTLNMRNPLRITTGGKTIMENQETNQNRIEPKIRVSKDGKWVIMNVPGIEQAIIKPVAYFEKILQSAKERANSGFSASIETIKG